MPITTDTKTVDKANYMINILRNRKETINQLQPVNKDSAEAGSNIKFRIASDSYIDFSKSYFTYELEMVGAAAAIDHRMTPNSESWIKRMTITASNAVLEGDWDHRDVLYNGLIRHTVSKGSQKADRGVMANVDYNEVYGAEICRGDTVRTAVANIAAPIGPFTTQSNLGMLANGRLFPAKYTGAILFDIDLQSLNALAESTVATNNVATPVARMTFKKIEFIYVTVDYGPQFDAMIEAQIASPEGLTWKYDSYVSQVDQQNGTSWNSKMNINSTSLKTIYSLFRKDPTVDAALVDNTNTIAGHNYRFCAGLDAVDPSYYYKVMNRNYPNFLAKIKTHGYQELKRALNQLGDVKGNGQVRELTGTTFNAYIGGNAAANNAETGSLMLGVNLEEHEPHMVSGINTNGALDITLSCANFPVAGAAGYTINHFMHVDRVLVVRPAMVLEVIH